MAGKYFVCPFAVFCVLVSNTSSMVFCQISAMCAATMQGIVKASLNQLHQLI